MRPLVAAVLLFGACSSESSIGGATISASDADSAIPIDTAPTDTAATETAATNTAATNTTAPSGTAGTVATTGASSTSELCAATGDTTGKGQSGVLTMSGMVGADIRVGDHDCFERLVVEMADGPGDFPGWGAEYVDDPVRLGESDEFTNIKGSVTLLLRMGMWMPSYDLPGGYRGPTQIFPTTVDHILELRQTENFEGITIWAIGLDAEYPFSVTEMSSPARVVIDFQVAE